MSDESADNTDRSEEWATGLIAIAPNPTSGGTVIHFSLERAGLVGLDILDPGGRLVRRLFAGSETPGPKIAEWDGRDDAGTHLSAGVYFVRLTAGGRHFSLTIVRLE